MSPANVYRFFPSKNAIVEAICQRCLSELDDKAWEVARSRASASARMVRLFVEIFNYHRDNLITEKRVHDIVLVAMENNWDAIEKHTEVIRTVIEVILRDGIASGEFDPVDPRETSVLIKRSMIVFCHPLMVAECLRARRRRDRSAPVRAVPSARHYTSEVMGAWCLSRALHTTLQSRQAAETAGS